MFDLYNNRLSSALWHWRAERLLIGPQLISLYFRDKGYEKNKGFFPELTEPTIVGRVKIYPQEYFSPKFTTTGKKLNVTQNTCIYHLFANLNVEQVDPEAEKHRREPMLFRDYCEYLASLAATTGTFLNEKKSYRTPSGHLNFRDIMLDGLRDPIDMARKIWHYAKK